MDLTTYRRHTAQMSEQLAALAAHALADRVATVSAPDTGSAYTAGAQDVARWLTDGVLTPELARLLADVAQHTTPAEGRDTHANPGRRERDSDRARMPRP